MNTVLDVIENRVSLRNYSEREITDETLNLLLNAAMRAPTGGNMMMYSIIVIKDQKIKDVLAETCDHQPFIARAPVTLLFIADMQKWHRYFKLSDVDEFEEARHGSYQNPSISDLIRANNDAAIAAQNVVIAAESLGIGSCYIGGIMENYEIHRELLNLEKYQFPTAMLTLGYYKESAKKIKKSRFDSKFIVFENKNKILSDEEIREMFKEQEKSFSPSNPYDAKNYGQMFYGRKNGSDYMKEIKRSIGVMLKNWTD